VRYEDGESTLGTMLDGGDMFLYRTSKAPIGAFLVSAAMFCADAVVSSR
jgi:hypothetical protein